MRILFVHQNFPGQYVHMATALAAMPDMEVVALSMRSGGSTPGVRIVQHAVERGSTPNIHGLAQDFESKVLRGESAARAALTLRAEGFTPDVICGHPGWGETLFLKDVWPDSPLLSFLEFAYSPTGADVGFDPEFPLRSEEDRFKVRAKNAAVFLALEGPDWFVSPTQWQAQQFPGVYRNRISVIHDGIDTDLIRPNAKASITLGRDMVKLKPGDEVVTFVNRNLEPYRGYHSFMRALPEIMRSRPRARVVLVGGSAVSYGATAPTGQTYRDIYLEEVKRDVDMTRVHFVGSISYAAYLTLLQVSAAHVYLTYPFVLSWSLLEAMAAGCPVVASATPPVEEVIRDGENGLLVDFFSPTQIAMAVIDILAHPRAHQAMRDNARSSMTSDFDLKRICLPRHLQLLKDVASGAKSASRVPLIAAAPQ